MFKKITAFRKSEKGSVTVMVAVCMTVLLGFTSLAVDYGSLANQKSLLQNAADSAALAGVVIPGAAGETAAKEYVMKNIDGVSAEDITVTRPTEKTMKVTIKKDAKAFFSQVLTGNTTNEVGATATAKYAGKIQAPGYAIWAEGEINLKNKSEVNGNLHSVDNNFNIHHGATINGDRTYGDEVPMPDYSYVLDGAVVLDPSTLPKKGNRISINSTVINSLSPDLVYYINDPSNKTVEIEGPLKLNIVANGDIVFNGSGAEVDAKILYSINGDVTLNGSGGVLSVIAYAPKGDITWNGEGTGLRGAIIGKTFIENGSNASVSYDEDVVGKFAKLIPHLIE